MSNLIADTRKYKEEYKRQKEREKQEANKPKPMTLEEIEHQELLKIQWECPLLRHLIMCDDIERLEKQIRIQEQKESDDYWRKLNANIKSHQELRHEIEEKYNL